MTTENPTASIILDAARELRATSQLVTRDTLATTTGLALTTIDERVKHLVDQGLMNRVQRGVFEPVEVMPPARPIYHAVLPGNIHKLEVGDVVLTLTPQEARTMGHMLAGAAIAFHVNDLAYQAVERNNELARQVAKVGRKLNKCD